MTFFSVIDRIYSIWGENCSALGIPYSPLYIFTVCFATLIIVLFPIWHIYFSLTISTTMERKYWKVSWWNWDIKTYKDILCRYQIVICEERKVHEDETQTEYTLMQLQKYIHKFLLHFWWQALAKRPAIDQFDSHPIFESFPLCPCLKFHRFQMFLLFL